MGSHSGKGTWTSDTALGPKWGIIPAGTTVKSNSDFTLRITFKASKFAGQHWQDQS